jgi:hypothetical protein
MNRTIAVLSVLLIILVFVGSNGVASSNPVPYTETPNLEIPILKITEPQNHSTYTSNIPLNFTIKQPDSWGAPTFWNYIGKVNYVNVSLDGNQTAEYTANHIYKYLNGNKTMIYPEDFRDDFSLSNICDWINQTTPGMHTLNVTVTSHTYSLSQYPGSNVKEGAVYDGQPIYEYPIIVSDTIYFTNTVDSTPTPTTPELPFLSVITLLAVASVSLVYFKRRRGKT